MAYNDAPLYYLKQAMGQLDEDWVIDYADEYEALENWFIEAQPQPIVLERLVADIDKVFAEEPDAPARLALFPYVGLRVETFDDFLRAIRKRAADGLAGHPEPMRVPKDV